MEDMEASETGPKATSPGPSGAKMTLDKAVQMGEYHPDFLAQFPEWHSFTRHVQFEYIRKALDNRRGQLLTQWADINNLLDFRLKPHLKDALKNVEKQLNILKDDRERLLIEYSEQ